MRALLIALGLLILLPHAAGADELLWRRTTPRAELAAGTDALLLRVPEGRAWGITSQALPLPATVRAFLEVPAHGVREAFVRVAFYRDPEGRGRQELVMDGALVRAGEAGESAVRLKAPDWARSVKVRVLVRREPEPMPWPVRVLMLDMGPPTAHGSGVVLREVRSLP